METPGTGRDPGTGGVYRDGIGRDRVRSAMFHPIALLQIQSQRQGRRGRTKIPPLSPPGMSPSPSSTATTLLVCP